MIADLEALHGDVDVEEAQALEELLSALSLPRVTKDLFYGIPNVVSIDLREKNLRGKIPDTIASFSKLRSLNLEYNEITELPSKFGNLKELQEIFLKRNSMQEFPQQIRTLSKLQKIDLRSNHIKEIPSWLSELTSLSMLRLYGNLISDATDTLCELTNLCTLDLATNQIKSVSNSLGWLKNVTNLYIDHNALTSIPDSIGDMERLERCNLENNRLTCVPDSIGKLMKLSKLFLTCNQLVSVPDSIGDLHELTYLSLDSNKLTEVPDSIGNLRNLAHLKLSKNRLTELPDSMSNLLKLTTLYLDNNRLTEMPSWVGELVNLERLDFSGNDLLTYPCTINMLTNLQSFRLNDNPRLREDRILQIFPAHLAKIHGTSDYNKWCESNKIHFECMLGRLPDNYTQSNDIEDSFGWTPLMYAAEQRMEVTLKLLDLGADLKKVTSDKAVKYIAFLLTVTGQLEGHDVDVDRINLDDTWRNSLSFAAEFGNEEIIKKLLAKGANPNKSDIYGWTPLHWAIRGDRPSVITPLLSANARVVQAENDAGNRMFLYDGPEIYRAQFANKPNYVCKFDKRNKSDLVEISDDETVASVGVGDFYADKNERSIVYLTEPIYVGYDVVCRNYVEFEVLQLPEFLEIEKDVYICFGLADPDKLKAADQKLPGLDPRYYSYGYFSRAGNYYMRANQMVGEHGEKVLAGDTVGIGFNYENKSIFYTHNGKLLSVSFGEIPKMKLFPVIGFRGKRGYSVRVKYQLSKCDGQNLTTSHFGSTALHLAAARGDPYVVKLLLNAKAEIKKKDKAGRTPLHWAAEKNNEKVARYFIESWGAQLDEDACSAVNRFMVEAMRNCDFKKILYYGEKGVKLKVAVQNLSEAELERCVSEFTANESWPHYENFLRLQNFAFWFSAVTLESSLCAVETFLSRKVESGKDFIHSKDEKNRAIVSVATPKIADLILSMTLWCQRYQLLETTPEHVSLTTIVYKATDEIEYETEGPNKGNKSHRRVALKITCKRDKYLMEVERRKEFSFDSRYVLPLLDYFEPSEKRITEDENVNSVEISSACTVEEAKNNSMSMYCLIMPLADRNLYVSLKQEFAASRDREKMAISIFRELVECTKHVHLMGIIHGSIKPSSLVKNNNTWKLIDLNASKVIGGEKFVRSRSGSAYLPPEAISSTHTYSDSLIAHESFDIWSLGCILYQLVHPRVLPLFQADFDDNLIVDGTEEDSLGCLFEWTDETKRKKLSAIRNNIEAYDLLSKILVKNPSERITISEITQHAFFSTSHTSRQQQREEPVWDVFISYRNNSNALEAEALYQVLTLCGLRVFFDQKSLKDAEDWQVGFTKGLLSSRVFVCLLSAKATTPFLIPNARCDNLLLELGLALELQSQQRISRIFPIFIGELELSNSPPEFSTKYKHFKMSALLSNYTKETSEETETLLRKHLKESNLVPLYEDHSAYRVLLDVSRIQGHICDGKIIDLGVAAERIKSIADEATAKQFSTTKSSPKKIKSKLKEIKVAADQIQDIVENLEEKLKKINIEMSEYVVYRVECPGFRLPVRAAPTADGEILYYIRNGDEVTTMRTIQNGHIEIIDNRILDKGYLLLSTNKVTFTQKNHELAEGKITQQPQSAEHSNGTRRMSIQGISSVGSNPLANVRKLSVSRPSMPLTESNL